jgi:galactokinase
MSSNRLELLTADVVAKFEEKFSASPDVVVAAPGRVNLIGEHIDYNDGFVLPMAIERYTVIAAKVDPANNSTATLYSIDMDQQVEISLVDPAKKEDSHWSNYVAGVVAGMVQDKGMVIPGFQAVAKSNVPIGGGLSSSASLEVATATVIEAIVGQAIAKVDKGLVCQKAEHEFAGVPCGIMDQFSSVLCEPDRLLLLDCRDRSFQQIPFSNPDIVVLIINSEVKHQLSGGEYAQRRSQCEDALKELGASSYRDVTLQQLEAKKDALDNLVYNRAHHVVTEIDRTLKTAEAMKQNDWATVGELMYVSHASLRDDFEVSCVELDVLVDIASKTEGVIGARMTGGGFGGCIVALVQKEKSDSISDSICKAYQSQTGVKPSAFMTRPAQGAHVIKS